MPLPGLAQTSPATCPNNASTPHCPLPSSPVMFSLPSCGKGQGDPHGQNSCIKKPNQKPTESREPEGFWGTLGQPPRPLHHSFISFLTTVKEHYGRITGNDQRSLQTRKSAPTSTTKGHDQKLPSPEWLPHTGSRDLDEAY